MLHLQLKTVNGALAHPARASDWQSEGDRFESDMLHTAQDVKGDTDPSVSPLLFTLSRL